MARFVEPTAEQEAAYSEWVASRPPSVRAVAERFEPWSLYRLTPTGQRVTVHSFGEQEDGGVSLTVRVSGLFNLVTFEREVFGVPPDHLEPCDLPAADERTGVLWSPEETMVNLDAMRLQLFPDLWTVDADGHVVKKTPS